MHRNKYFWGFVILVFFAFVYVFVFSGSGIIERTFLRNKTENLSRTIDELKLRTSELQQTLNAYENGLMTDDDYLRAGYISKGAKRLVFSGEEKEASPEPAEVKEPGLELIHMRVVWLVTGMLVMLFWFSRKSRSGESGTDDKQNIYKG